MTYLDQHLQPEDDGEEVVTGDEEEPLVRLGRDVGPLHGQGDAVESDEEEDRVVEPLLRGEPPTQPPHTVQEGGGEGEWQGRVRRWRHVVSRSPHV